MKVGAVPETPIEWAVARLNVAPRPLLETQLAYTLARVIMVATKLEIFEALAGGRATAATVAERCGTSPAGTEKLLFALAGAEYVRVEDGGYALTPLSRKWLLRESPHSLADKMLLQLHEWDWLEHAEDYVRTGEPIELHSAGGTRGCARSSSTCRRPWSTRRRYSPPRGWATGSCTAPATRSPTTSESRPSTWS